MNKIFIAHIYLFIANLIYALNYTLAKDVMPDFILPSGFILLRVFGAVILFGLSYFIFIKEKVELKDISRLALCGVFGVAVNQLLFFEGLNLTTPINASIIMTSNPILVIIISFIIVKEKITYRKVVGVILGIFGAAILILKSGDVQLNNGMQLGNLFVFINAASYGLYLVIVKPLMQKYKPITVMFFIFSFGLLYVTPFGLNDLLNVSWETIPVNIYWEILFVVVFTTFIAYLCISTALKNLKSSTVSIYIYLQPILATLFAVYLGSDTIDETKIFATITIFIGVYLVSVGSLKLSKQKLS